MANKNFNWLIEFLGSRNFDIWQYLLDAIKSGFLNYANAVRQKITSLESYILLVLRFNLFFSL